ncbi:MAG: A/G-specific adenine glycosylase [Candidatus Lambdaproteobacteria bacterium]|nr:A/G-specific adenine glycosylase [Candidatus Lambdaproteobacteria bacterium]
MLRWFAGAQRALPWREGYDPYAVWVSEMMLQQTQVDTVLPYFARWMARFPTIEAVAAAPEEDVLKLWEGLGYYARARNLHRAARQVVSLHEGRLPAEIAALRALPGIGPYTAGAIASIGHNLPEPAVDGNVGRVLSRLFARAASPREPRGLAALQALARALIPAGRARAFNQALMELGALVCRDRAPGCLLCPVRAHCRAHAQGAPERYPPRVARPARPRVETALVVAQRGGRLLLRRRPARGLWGGLWEFPWVELAAGEPPAGGLARLLATLPLGEAARPSTLGAAAVLGTVAHGLTHRELRFHAFALELRDGIPAPPADADADGAGAEARWVTRPGLAALPLGRPMHKVLALADRHVSRPPGLRAGAASD